MSTPAYEKWKTEPTPDNLASVMSELDPVINSEIHRYPGPKPLLRGRARKLAVDAIYNYKPEAGTQLRSWVTTQLQPLSRYSNKLKPIKLPEASVRQAAEINRLQRELASDLGHDPSDEELADTAGISVKRIQHLRKTIRPVMSESSMAQSADDENGGGIAPGIDSVRSMSGSEDAVYGGLSPRDQQIFDMKTGKHGRQVLSNQDIARRMGVTPALISQRSQMIAGQIQEAGLKGVF